MSGNDVLFTRIGDAVHATELETLGIDLRATPMPNPNWNE
jgi:hypothetical protein